MKNKPIIILDTREQTPFVFSDKVEVIRTKLDTGDYSLKGMEDQFCIERKSIEDIYGCIFKTRFQDCLDRMKLFSYAEIIIEGTYKEVKYGVSWALKRYSRVNSKSLLGKLNSIQSIGIHVAFIDRKEASNYAESVLDYHWRKYYE